MNDDAAIKEAIDRNVKAVTLRANVARGVARTKAVLHPGLDCTVSEGPYELKVAMSEKYGGRGGAPNPGVLGRGALASCLAIGYGMWAARLDVPCDSIEVDVEAPYDVRGELGVSDDVRPGYSEIRYTVSVISACAEADVLRMLDTADRCSSFRDIFANSMPLTRDVRVSAPEV